MAIGDDFDLDDFLAAMSEITFHPSDFTLDDSAFDFSDAAFETLSDEQLMSILDTPSGDFESDDIGKFGTPKTDSGSTFNRIVQALTSPGALKLAGSLGLPIAASIAGGFLGESAGRGTLNELRGITRPSAAESTVMNDLLNLTQGRREPTDIETAGESTLLRGITDRPGSAQLSEVQRIIKGITDRPMTGITSDVEAELKPFINRLIEEEETNRRQLGQELVGQNVDVGTPLVAQTRRLQENTNRSIAEAIAQATSAERGYRSNELQTAMRSATALPATAQAIELGPAETALARDPTRMRAQERITNMTNALAAATSGRGVTSQAGIQGFNAAQGAASSAARAPIDVLLLQRLLSEGGGLFA